MKEGELFSFEPINHWLRCVLSLYACLLCSDLETNLEGSVSYNVCVRYAPMSNGWSLSPSPSSCGASIHHARLVLVGVGATIERVSLPSFSLYLRFQTIVPECVSLSASLTICV